MWLPVLLVLWLIPWFVAGLRRIRPVERLAMIVGLLLLPIVYWSTFVQTGYTELFMAFSLLTWGICMAWALVGTVESGGEGSWDGWSGDRMPPPPPRPHRGGSAPVHPVRVVRVAHRRSGREVRVRAPDERTAIERVADRQPDYVIGDVVRCEYDAVQY